MKVAVIGNGNVGLATFAELQKLSEIDEIVLIGRRLEAIKGEVEDYKDSAILRPYMTPKLSFGDYSKTKDADIIIYTAGAAQKPGQSRLELLEENIKVVDNIFAEVNKYNDNSLIIVLSNPVDLITYEVLKVTGRPKNMVIGTGTLLDTARCIKLISGLLEISPTSVNMFVIGEHGDSSVTVLSSLSLLGMSLDEYLSSEIGGEIEVDSSIMSENIRSSAAKLISAKGYTAYGVASAAVRLAYEMIHDTNVILPVSTLLEGEYGVENVSISVPCIIGRSGVKKIHTLKLNEEENAAFHKSVEILKNLLKNFN